MYLNLIYMSMSSGLLWNDIVIANIHCNVALTFNVEYNPFNMIVRMCLKFMSLFANVTWGVTIFQHCFHFLSHFITLKEARWVKNETSILKKITIVQGLGEGTSTLEIAKSHGWVSWPSSVKMTHEKLDFIYVLARFNLFVSLVKCGPPFGFHDSSNFF